MAARGGIYGASYGAYAALMGAAKEPVLYRCAAGYVGVYDLPMMQRGDMRTARSLGNWPKDCVGTILLHWQRLHPAGLPSASGFRCF